MHTKFSILIINIFVSVCCIAQNNVVVYHVTGTVNLISGNSVKPAIRGTVIPANSSLQLKERSTCMLIDNTGKSVQINTAGTYAADVLKTQVTAQSSTDVTKKFFSYVYQSLLSHKPSAQMAITPVVFRDIQLQPKKTVHNYTIVLSEKIAFRWKATSNKPVKITVQKAELNTSNQEDKIRYTGFIDSVFATSNELVSDAQINLLPPGFSYRWKAEPAHIINPAKQFIYFLVAKKQDYAAIKKDQQILQTTGLSAAIKLQLEKDLFEKWQQKYLKPQANL
ncbi:hypothetical protein BH09BAC2_BH09BAC2_21710 [soil metagenome]